MSFRNDMTMMFTVHDALRRELGRIAAIAARPGDDPRRVLRAAAGWELFKGYLHIHHTAEDETVWPVMAPLLAGRPADLALVAAMEAEHAAIDPLLQPSTPRWPTATTARSGSAGWSTPWSPGWAGTCGTRRTRGWP